MPEKIRVKVASGIVLRDPKTMQMISTEGTLVTKSAFWLRRLKAGDCQLVGDKKLNILH